MMPAWEYDIEGNYGYGWEVVTCEETLADARRMLNDYNVNESQYPHRIRRVRREA